MLAWHRSYAIKPPAYGRFSYPHLLGDVCPLELEAASVILQICHGGIMSDKNSSVKWNFLLTMRLARGRKLHETQLTEPPNATKQNPGSGSRHAMTTPGRLTIPDPPLPWPVPEMRSPPATQASELAMARQCYELACIWAEYARNTVVGSRQPYIDRAMEYAAAVKRHEAEAARLGRIR